MGAQLLSPAPDPDPHDVGHGPLAPLLVGHAHDRDVEHVRMGGECLLHPDGGDVLPARDDDVLGPVLELEVSAGVHGPGIPGVVPAAAEHLGRGGLVLAAAEHRVVPPQHHLARGPPVGGHVPHPDDEGCGLEPPGHLQDRATTSESASTTRASERPGT